MKILKFYSDTCGPCKMLDTLLKRANIKYDSININEEKNDTLIEKYDIRTVPTLIKEKEGIEIERFIGIMPEQQLKKWCND